MFPWVRRMLWGSAVLMLVGMQLARWLQCGPSGFDRERIASRREPDELQPDAAVHRYAWPRWNAVRYIPRRKIRAGCDGFNNIHSVHETEIRSCAD